MSTSTQLVSFSAGGPILYQVLYQVTANIKTFAGSQIPAIPDCQLPSLDEHYRCTQKQFIQDVRKGFTYFQWKESYRWYIGYSSTHFLIVFKHKNELIK